MSVTGHLTHATSLAPSGECVGAAPGRDIASRIERCAGARRLEPLSPQGVTIDCHTSVTGQGKM